MGPSIRRPDEKVHNTMDLPRSEKSPGIIRNILHLKLGEYKLLTLRSKVVAPPTEIPAE